MRMKPVQLLAVSVENRPGQLARISKELADASVNIHWVGIADFQQSGLIRFLVDKCDLAYQWLKQHDFTVSLVEILAVEVEDRPGGLHGVASALAGERLSLNNVSGFVFNHRAILLLELAELDRARRLLAQRQYHLLSEDEMLSL